MVSEGGVGSRGPRGLVLEDGQDVITHRLSQLNQLRRGRHFCDVVLQVGRSEIFAHRAVLACASPYFYELFSAEDEQKSALEGRLLYKLNSGFDRESIEHLVNYAYTGRLDLPPAVVRQVYVAARRLKMERVMRACGDYLVSHLSPDNCVSIRAIQGIASADPGLVAQVDDFIKQQHDLVGITRDALGVPRLQVVVVHQSSAEADATTGHALCRLVVEWTRSELQDTDTTLDMFKEKKHMLYLNLDNALHDCSEIQSGELNDSEIVQDYKKMSIRNANPKPRRKISNTQPIKPRLMLYSRAISEMDDGDIDQNWIVIAHQRVADYSWVAIASLGGSLAVVKINQKLSSSPHASPIPSRPPSMEKVDFYTVIPAMGSRKCSSGVGVLGGQLLVCGGYDRGECLRTAEAYCPRENDWKRLPDMIKARGRFDLTVLDGKAYAVGGCDGNSELRNVEMLEVGADKWVSVAPLPLARSNTGVCHVDGKVLCIGGWNGQYGIKQCDAYQPDTNQWSTIAPLSVGRYQAGVATLAGRVYVFGGCDSWNCLSSMEVYDPAEDLWAFAAAMTTPRRGCGAAVLNGKLYAIGGSDGQQSLCSTEVFDPSTKTWMPGPSMMTCRANVGVAVMGNRIYAAGGFSGKNFLNSVEYLDPDTNEWTNFTPKPELIRELGDHGKWSFEGGQDNGHHGQENGHHGHANGGANGHANGGANGHANGGANGHANGGANSHANGGANGLTYGHANGSTNGHANGDANGHANGDANGHANGGIEDRYGDAADDLGSEDAAGAAASSLAPLESAISA